jgi:AcrR family transcriptional regulator
VSDTTAAPPETVARPLRADARRNRERILKAARAVFAEHGREAQMDDVARRAKVGVGTLYRHFPTKEALLQGIAVDKFVRLERIACQARDTISDPWEAVSTALWDGAEQLAADRALFDVLGDANPSAECASARTCVRATFEQLLTRAQAAGAVRDDVTVDHVPLIMMGVGAAIRAADGDEARWRTYFRVVLDGLRAPYPGGQ